MFNKHCQSVDFISIINSLISNWISGFAIIEWTGDVIWLGRYDFINHCMPFIQNFNGKLHVIVIVLACEIQVRVDFRESITIVWPFWGWKSDYVVWLQSRRNLYSISNCCSLRLIHIKNESHGIEMLLVRRVSSGNVSNLFRSLG